MRACMWACVCLRALALVIVCIFFFYFWHDAAYVVQHSVFKNVLSSWGYSPYLLVNCYARGGGGGGGGTVICITEWRIRLTQMPDAVFL